MRFIPWSEILARAPKATRLTSAPFRIPISSGGAVIPDGLFGLEYLANGSRSYRFFALEADRGTMPLDRSDASQTSYFAKLNAYADLLSGARHRLHWGISSLLVLTVMTDEQRVSEAMRRFERMGGLASFLFKCVGDLSAPVPHLLSGPWRRANMPAVHIGEP